MNPILVRKIIYPLLLFRRGNKTLSYLKEYENSQWLSKEALEEYQMQKLSCLLRHAYDNVPFYRRRFDEVGLLPEDVKTHADILQLPTLSKQDITSNLADMKASNIEEKLLKQNATGGSTGEMLIFFQDKRRIEHEEAMSARCYRWCGLDIGDKQASIWGAPSDISRSKRLRARILNNIFNRLYIDAFELSEDVMRDFADKIVSFKPKVIIGYANALYTLAKFAEQNEIQLYHPNAVISSAEVLYEHQRKLIESVFGCKVFNHYGSREMGTIAFECEYHQGMHITENVLVEFVRDGKHVSDGELGEIVVTDLNNYGMPFIRYRLGDMGIPLGANCECGRGLPLLKSVEGRTADMIATPEGKIIHGEYFTHLFYFMPSVKQFQIIQTDASTLIIKIVQDKTHGSVDIASIQEEIMQHVSPRMLLNFELVEYIPKTKSGKHRFTISKIPLAFK